MSIRSKEWREVITKTNLIWYHGSLYCLSVSQGYFGSRQQILTLAKKKHKQKNFPEWCWLALYSKGELVPGQKGQGQPGPVSAAPSRFATSPFCASSYEDSLKQVFQLVVEMTRSTLISFQLWDQRGKDSLSPARRLLGRKSQWFAWGHAILLYRDILEGCG